MKIVSCSQITTKQHKIPWGMDDYCEAIITFFFFIIALCWATGPFNNTQLNRCCLLALFCIQEKFSPFSNIVHVPARLEGWKNWREKILWKWNLSHWPFRRSTIFSTVIPRSIWGNSFVQWIMDEYYPKTYLNRPIESRLLIRTNFDADRTSSVRRWTKPLH